MPNRFYTPSPTQYTSQFVAEQYPYEAMLALEEKKVNRAEDVMGQLGQMDVQFGSLMGGPSTQTLAKEVADKYKNKVGEFLEKNRDLSSPQTIRDLSALRASYTSDPIVKSVLQDQTIGLPQYMQISGSRKTPRDIDPNVDPETGQVRQLKSGEQWAPYKQLQHYIDWKDPLTKSLQQVDYKYKDVNTLGISRIKDPETGMELPILSGEKGRKGIRGEEEFRPAVETLANDIMEGRLDYADWYKRDFENTYGRKPTYEEVVRDISEMAVPLYGEDPQTTPFFQQISGLDSASDAPLGPTGQKPATTPLDATTSLEQSPNEQVAKGFSVSNAGTVRPKRFVDYFDKTPARDIGLTVGKIRNMGKITGGPFAILALARRKNMEKVDEWIDKQSGFHGAILKSMRNTDDSMRGKGVNNDAKAIMHELKNTGSDDIYANWISKNKDFDITEKDGKYDIKGLSKQQTFELAEETANAITKIGNQFLHPHVQDFEEIQISKTKKLTHNDIVEHYDKKLNFERSKSLVGKEKIRSLEAVLGEGSFQIYGQPDDVRYSIEDLVDEGYIAFSTRGILEDYEENIVHPNSLVINATDKDGSKAVQILKPETDSYAFPGGQDQIDNNYTNFIIRSLKHSPITDMVLPTEYEVFDNMKQQPETSSPVAGETNADAEEGYLKRMRYPYTRFKYDPKKKKLVAHLSVYTPFVVGDEKKEIKEVVSDKVTGSTKDELIENYTNAIQQGRDNALEYVMGGISKEEVEKLGPYELYWINALLGEQ